MRKIIITACFVCITAMGFAWPNLGVKAGVNFLNMSDVKDLKMQPGFDVGAFARLKFHKFYLQPEVLYSFQSVKSDFSNILFDKNKTHNLLVPILVGYKLIDLKLMNLRVFAGPEFGFVLGSDPSYYDPAFVNIMGDVGVGLDIAMITFDFKYGYAFNKTFDDGKIHNNLFSISLGWKFL